MNTGAEVSRPLFVTLADARARLIATGISEVEASHDVDLYARTILGWDRGRLVAERSGASPATLEPRFSEWIARREQREPSAYIIGVREFWGLDFAVTPSVLIPRPETEFIVEEALPLLRARGAQRVADIGTGSGCLAVTLAREVGTARVVASDLSAEALTVARHNALRHGVAERIDFVQTSYLTGVDSLFDVIVANPPYVREGDKPGLSRDVRHEPDVALFGGSDGLRDIGGVLETAERRLAPGGWLIMEFGYSQDNAVLELIATIPSLRLGRIRHDLQDIPRTAVIQKTPPHSATSSSR